MHKFLFSLRFFLGFVALLCLGLSYSGLSYLELGWYVATIIILFLEVMLTLYDIFTKREDILNHSIYNSLGIGMFLYITLLYMRLFFDHGMLYVEGNLMIRFMLINHHLPILSLGLLGLVIYHICIELEKKKQKRRRKVRK